LSGQLCSHLETAFCLAAEPAPAPLRLSDGAGSHTSMKSAIRACESKGVKKFGCVTD